ncbi:hypothetical protein [Paenibacillus sp.]|uniref:hypothetical protein n=1 Tax=Paenibacillus sp. TaxID=58172 RepID=UPI0028126969|nr:hypothetical protein [Paenibacillus sp.]
MKVLLFILISSLLSACEAAHGGGQPSVREPFVQEVGSVAEHIPEPNVEMKENTVAHGLGLDKETVQLHSFDNISNHSFQLLVPGLLPEGYVIKEIFDNPHSVEIILDKDAGDLTVELGSISFLQSSVDVVRTTTAETTAEGHVTMHDVEVYWAEFPGDRLVINWRNDGVFYQVEGEQAELEDCLFLVEHLKPL